MTRRCQYPTSPIKNSNRSLRCLFRVSKIGEIIRHHRKIMILMRSSNHKSNRLSRTTTARRRNTSQSLKMMLKTKRMEKKVSKSLNLSKNRIARRRLILTISRLRAVIWPSVLRTPNSNASCITGQSPGLLLTSKISNRLQKIYRMCDSSMSCRTPMSTF